MSEKSDWPELTWTAPEASPIPWYARRVNEIALKVRGFELAMERAAEQGQVELPQVESELEDWDGYSESVFMYVGLTRSNEVDEESVPYYVEELEVVYNELKQLREAMLVKLGAAAPKIRQTEATLKVTDEQITERLADVSDEGGEEDGDEGGEEEEIEEEPELPVTVDELRMRQASEQKLLPAKLELTDLLGHLPAEWVNAIFQNLGLEEDEDNESSIRGTRTSRYRALICDYLRDPERLAEALDSVGEEGHAILTALLAKKGMMEYLSVTEKFGADDADGFFWSDRPPSGALALLRRSGLVYVGGYSGRPVAVVPNDLIPMIKPLLGKG